MSMWQEFKTFLIKQNAIALAIAVVLGVALNALVQAIVNDFIMPFVTLLTPEAMANWKELYFSIGRARFTYGDFLSALLNFFIIGFVAWRISKVFVKPAPAPATKPCPYCRMQIDAEASRCPHCTSQLAVAAVA